MGAMASLMYVVYWTLKKRDHGISSLLLLSPAGFHHTAPVICKLTGPLISWVVKNFPIYAFKFPSEIGRLFAAKMVEDVKHNYSARNLFSFITYKLLGGDSMEHAVTQAHNLTYNIFAGTSTGVFLHFWQNWTNRAFESFDYGPEKNMDVYGTPYPVDIMRNLCCIDIPTYFVMGLRDSLIEPSSILKVYEVMYNAKPDKAFLKAFPKMGHIDFTVGENAELTNFIQETLAKTHNDDDDSPYVA